MERMTGILAWRLAVVSGALTAAGLTILLLTIDRPSVALWGFRSFEAIFAVETILIGALIMSRRPENIIGALFAVPGLLSAHEPLVARRFWDPSTVTAAADPPVAIGAAGVTRSSASSGEGLPGRPTMAMSEADLEATLRRIVREELTLALASAPARAADGEPGPASDVEV